MKTRAHLIGLVVMGLVLCLLVAFSASQTQAAWRNPFGSDAVSLTVCGLLPGDTTWTLADSPVVVDCDVTVQAAHTLTIQPGVIVKFEGPEDELFVYGRLLAVGTASQPIVFTSLKDDAHGDDTNGDGSATSPAPNDWGAIRIFPGAFTSELAYTWIGYGGTGAYCNLELNTSQVSVHDNTLAYANENGIGLKGVAAGVPFVLQDNDFIGNTKWPIYAYPNGLQTSISLSGNTSQGSPINGVGMHGQINVPVTYTGQADLPFVMEWDVTVAAEASLTFTPGTVVKFQDYADELYAYGPLFAVGTASQPIVFTSLKDDAHGGDTNNDGNATSPAPADWGAIRIFAGTFTSELAYTWIGYGGTGAYCNLELNTSQVSVHDNTLVYANGSGIGLKGVAAGVPYALQDNDFIGNTSWPVYAYPAGLQTSISLSGNTSQGSPINGVGMNGNISTSVTYTGQDDLPFVVYGDVIIDAGAALTLTPGSVVKFQDYADELYAYGPLTAVGTASQPIVFTSLKDDAHGGDTNNDGNASSPAPADWGMVRIFPGGAGSRIEHTWIGYGGSGGFCNLELNTSQVSVHDNTLAYANGSGIGLKGVAAGVPYALQDNDFIGNTSWPVYAYPAGLQTSISLSGNTSQGSPINGVGMNGNISTSVTYTGQDDLPFVVYGDVIIDAGAALTLTPGSVVKFQDYADELYAYGSLTAVGTVEQPIVFTSLKDDAHGGDTNNDGSASSPASVDWGMVRIFPGGAGSRIEHTWIGYGGSGGFCNLELNTSQVSVHDNTLAYANGSGIGLKGVAAGVPFDLQSNDFISNTTYPIYGYPTGLQTSISLSGNTSQGSPVNGLGMYGQISAVVTYTGQADFPFVVEADITVAAGAALTFAPGTVVKFLDYADQLFAYGRLTAIGTSDQPIIFTSLKDDAHGGDTNSDGGATSPARGDWGNVRIEAGSSGSRIEHAWIGYGGGDGWSLVFLADSSAILQDSLVLESSNHGVLVTTNSPTIRHNLISSVRQAGVYATNNAQPVLRENVITGNGEGVHNTSTTVEVDAIQNYWGSSSGPYHPTTNPFGTGNRVSDRVRYAPWLENPPSDLLMLDTVLVGIKGGVWFHPGETTRIQAYYVNLTDHVIQDAVLVVRLPMVATYGGSEPTGIYWPARHEVFWKLGTVNPGEGGTYLITLKYLWGLPDEFHDGSSVLFAGSNQFSDLFDIQAYWDFIPSVVTGRDWLTQAEVDALRLSTPALEALYTQAVGEGFLYGVAAEYAFQSGTPQTQITLLKANPHAVRFLMVQDGEAYAITFQGNHFSMFNSAGGLDWDLETGIQTYSGTWAAPGNAAVCSLQGGGCCLRNCLKNGLGEAAIGRLSKLANAGFTARTCYQALESGDIDKIADCGTELTDAIPIAGEVKMVVACVAECAGDANSHDCTDAKKTCEKSLWYNILHAIEVDSYRHYYCEAGCLTWYDQFNCALVERCVEGRGCVDCQEPGVNCHNNSFNKAIDPNALYGPSGDLLAGQWVTYTIEYENMGVGAAEGVFVVDVLSEHFDDSTLAIGSGGEYYSGTRTLSWYIGQLAPNGQPGSTGQVSFSVQLKSGLAKGTEISNQAVVHFPSAPEVTPTNLLVGWIAEVAAIPQTLQAEAGQPLTIRLSGNAVGSLPLTYELVDEPAYGVLSGAPPSLTYTSMSNFTGPDRFTFRVSAGGQTSAPAEVLIQVEPWSGDVTPPQVLWTDPAPGATGVVVSATPVYSDSMGVVYAPAIGVQFDEAVSPTSLSQAFTLKDESGASIPVVVTYDGMSNRAVVFPLQALKQDEIYTVMVSGVEDLLGNAMAEDYTWWFDTGAGKIYLFLPLTVR